MAKKFFSAAVILLLIASVDNAAFGQQEILEPQSTGLYGNASALFQAPSPLLNAFRNKKFVYPFYQYLDLSVVNPKNNFSFNSYLRGREVFNGDQEILVE